MIIGLTGTFGAGKGTVAKILQKKGFKHYSVRALLIQEIKARNMPVNRDSMKLIADDLRETYGPGYWVETLYDIAKEETKNAVIESIRCPGEVELLKKKDSFLLFAIDADPLLRYQRIQKRKSESDQVSFTEFKVQEDSEQENKEPYQINLKWCRNHADVVILNEGSLKDLEKQVDFFLKKHEV